LRITPSPGDIDGDGDVTIADYLLFSACLSGPHRESPPLDCHLIDFAISDLDDDGHVDLADFAAFQIALGGN
jgi:hypothetical protein